MTGSLPEHESAAAVFDAPNLGRGPDDLLQEDRQWAEAVLSGQKRVLEMIAHSSSLGPILEALCGVVEQTSSYCFGSIYLLDESGKHLYRGAAPGLPKAFANAIEGHAIAESWGPCGMAVARKQAVIVSDIKTDSPCAEYRDLALAHGLQSCWSTPVLSFEGKVLGTFAVHCREPRTPTPSQANLLEQFAHLASIAIERTRGQEALRRSESRFQGILKIAEDAIISVDSRQHILLFNQGAEKSFGYAAHEVLGKSLEVLIPQRFAHAHQKHVQDFGTSPEVSRSMAERREVFGRRKDGKEFPAEASISKLDLGGEVVFTIILRDITERKHAAEALRASAQVARGQVEALTRTLDALAKESAPDRLVEHVLRTITEQLNAHSSSVWLRNEDTGLISFEFAFEGGRLVTRNDAELAQISPSLRIDDVQPWPQIFRTGKPGVLEDIREGPEFPWRQHVLSLGVITILIVPMLIAGQVEGVVGIRFTRKRAFRAEEMELAQALAHQATLSCQLRRLSRQSRQAAVVAERNRLARDIHDTLAQGFTGIIVQLEAIEEALGQGLMPKARECLSRAGALARTSLQEARRSVQALRPQTLEDNDLYEALQHLIQNMTAGTGVAAKFDVRGQPPELPQDWEENLLRISQEVLTNALRHAQAHHFNARFAFEEGIIQLTFTDDGKGFEPGARHDGFGLRGMRERVETMGGRLSIRSTNGQGTAVSIVLPFPKTQDVS